MTRPQDAATEALAEGCCVARFGLVPTKKMKNDPYSWGGACWRESTAEAKAVMAFLKRRGYVIRKARKSG